MSRELEEWQAKVDAFGGRIGSQDDKDVRRELARAQLGSIVSLPTSQLNPVFQDVITLAEVKLPRPVLMDVTFSYPNVRAAFPGKAALEVGTGFVRVTWGVAGANQNTAEISGGAGWRHPFTASYLRVDYLPIDPNAAGRPTVIPTLPGLQQRDLQIAATVAPAGGGPYPNIYKTEYFANIGANGSESYIIPNWAEEGTLSCDLLGLAPLLEMSYLNATATQVLARAQSRNAAPTFTGQDAFATLIVPQRARVVEIASKSVATGLNNPSVTFKLSI